MNVSGQPSDFGYRIQISQQRVNIEGKVPKEQLEKLSKVADGIFGKLKGLDATLEFTRNKGLFGNKSITIHVGDQAFKVKDRKFKSMFVKPAKKGVMIGNQILNTLLINQKKALLNHPNYRGNLDRDGAMKLLDEKPELGYVLRPSSHEGLETITYRDKGKMKHTQIKLEEKEWSCRGADSIEHFSKLDDLLSTMGLSTQNEIAIGKLKTQLTEAKALPDSPKQESIMKKYFEKIVETGQENNWQEDVGQYINILSPKETAVTGGGKAYNANTVTMPDGNSYIAAMAPEDDEVDGRQETFWKMAMENAPVGGEGGLIVDISNVSDEERDIDPYYPEDDNPMKIGDVEVKRIAYSTDKNTPHIEVTQYEVRNTKTDSSKLITRVHHKTWGDFDVTNVEDVAKLNDEINSLKTKSPNLKPIVHCRAGVGRTGTLLSCLTAGNLKKQGKKVDVDDIILQGKLQRGPMFVQTDEQYKMVQAYANK